VIAPSPDQLVSRIGPFEMDAGHTAARTFLVPRPAHRIGSLTDTKSARSDRMNCTTSLAAPREAGLTQT
jgi:hypothetical protein